MPAPARPLRNAHAPVSYRAGMAWMLLSGLSFGCVAIFGKLGYEAGYNFTSLLGIRWAVGAAALAVLLAARGERALPARRDAPAVAALGLLGIGLTSGLYFIGLARVEAGVASVILYTSPAMVALLSRLLGERLGRRGVSALALSTLGVALIAAIGRPAGADPLGIAIILAAALTYAVYIITGRRVGDRVAPGPLAVGVMASSAAGFLTVAPLLPGGLMLTAGEWGLLWAIGLGLIGSAVSIGAFFQGLPAVGASRAAILSTVEPLSTLLLAGLFLSEIPTPIQLGGAVCVLAAVVLLATRTPPPSARVTPPTQF